MSDMSLRIGRDPDARLYAPGSVLTRFVMADFVQTLITTLEVGSLYALIALGYTMVYGILKFINFAHSDIVVLGAWISYTLASKILPATGPRSAQSRDAAAVVGRRRDSRCRDAVLRRRRFRRSSGWPTGRCGERRGSTC